MATLEQDTTVVPSGSALLRLAELDAAINASAELLTPADVRAICRELNTVARTIKPVNHPKPSRRRTTSTATTAAPVQGDLLG